MSIRHHLTFHITPEKSDKAVVTHLPTDTSEEDMSFDLEELGFNAGQTRPADDSHAANPTGKKQ
jgi:hypothetical protein